MVTNAAFFAIWQVVESIPEGRVASYGQVARLAGLPGRARLVGTSLKSVPAGRLIPWHRVVNAQGRISLPPASTGYREQKRRLIAEGVRLAGGRIDLSRFGWRSGSESPLLD